MSRINTNVQAMIAQRVLGANQKGLATSLERLSTGLKINRGKDDPAGLIASNNLGNELKGLDAAIGNSERADQVASIAEGGLQELSSSLTELQGLITASANKAGLSKEERDANQLQVDSILQTIDRISGATNFQGTKLLNGSLDFETSSIDSGVSSFRINGAKYSGSALDVNVLVTKSAQQGALFVSLGASQIQTSGQTFTIEIGGATGSRQLSFSSTTTLANMVSTIQSYKDVTGVDAKVSGTGIRLFSTEFGSSNFSRIKVINSAGLGGSSPPPGQGVYKMLATDADDADTASVTTFANANNGVQDNGQDVAATINGVTATADGRTARINTDFLDVSVSLTTATAQTLGNVGGSNPTLKITGGGATFQMAGRVDITGQVVMGIADMSSRKLGDATLGNLEQLASGQSFNLTTGDLNKAQKIVGEAIKQVSGVRGRIGAFQKNVIGATVRSLNVAVENTAAAQSVIRDSDFASETAALTRSQILTSASTNILGLANQSPQSVLQLLG
jgi:flagellin